MDYTCSMRPSIVVLKDRLAPYLLECRERQWSVKGSRSCTSEREVYHVQSTGGVLWRVEIPPQITRDPPTCAVTCWTQFGWYLSPGLLQTWSGHRPCDGG